MPEFIVYGDRTEIDAVKARVSAESPAAALAAAQAAFEAGEAESVEVFDSLVKWNSVNDASDAPLLRTRTWVCEDGDMSVALAEDEKRARDLVVGDVFVEFGSISSWMLVVGPDTSDGDSVQVLVIDTDEPA